ncbi:hypothetical protein PR001_g25081 [Phytophthora rubi]|uniref:Uncharacterized protein n=1 Tax=Phytophthora rubi TaxID=129364 RepID=A0A6A3IA09_9STRA|nr:hypothetical protein PR001_g25081 [Phytophthora rubi]
MKGGKRQMGKRRSGDKFKLSPSLFDVFADRYLAARNAHKGVDYQRLSTTKYFKDFKGHAEELRAKDPELKVLLKKALAEQREIDAGKPMQNIEARSRGWTCSTRKTLRSASSSKWTLSSKRSSTV